MAHLLKIKAQVSSIWAKVCILMFVCMCVILLEMTTPPWGKEKVKVYYYSRGIYIQSEAKGSYGFKNEINNDKDMGLLLNET